MRDPWQVVPKWQFGEHCGGSWGRQKAGEAQPRLPAGWEPSPLTRLLTGTWAQQQLGARQPPRVHSALSCPGAPEAWGRARGAGGESSVPVPASSGCQAGAWYNQNRSEHSTATTEHQGDEEGARGWAPPPPAGRSTQSYLQRAWAGGGTARASGMPWCQRQPGRARPCARDRAGRPRVAAGARREAAGQTK